MIDLYLSTQLSLMSNRTNFSGPWGWKRPKFWSRLYWLGDGSSFVRQLTSCFTQV